MTVALPPPEWPRDLLSDGPPEDRSILLHGEAMIGRTRFVVTAVRVDPIQFGPDFRQDVHFSVYRDYHLSTLIDMMSELVDFDDPSTIRLETGDYLLWMVPAGQIR
jgi:hypothetical protein